MGICRVARIRLPVSADFLAPLPVRCDGLGKNPMDATRNEVEHVPAHLGLLDAVSLIVGIIIGVGVFETPALVFRQAPDAWIGLGVWALGGLLVLIGAFCFAELASTYPRSGGEYVYLTRAYGPLVGYLFAWAQLGIIRTGSIAALAYVFANYADRLWGLGSGGIILVAGLVIIGLTAINILGLTLGKGTQNLLTLLKVGGLGGIVVAGFLWGRQEQTPTLAGDIQEGWFAEAMILVLWTYAGWHEAAYIAAEVKNGRRNIPMALILGTAAVTLIYLLVNMAVLFGLGFQDARANSFAQDVLALTWGDSAGQALCVLVMISALGAVNGMIITTSRITTELGADHRLFAPLSKWSRRWGTPVRSLIVQGLVSLIIAVAIGLWFEGQNGFEALVYYTASVFWGFFLLTGIALFILRYKEPRVTRPFRVPGYPITPFIFCLWCAYMVYGSIRFKPQES